MLHPVPKISEGPYLGPGLAALLRANEDRHLLRQQQMPANQSGAANGSNASASIAVQLERTRAPYFYPFGVSFQIWFTDVNGAAAAPGTFEIDVQTSDLDIDGQFVNEGALTAVNSSNAGRVWLTLSWMRYVRVYVKTLTNNVYINVLVSR